MKRKYSYILIIAFYSIFVFDSSFVGNTKNVSSSNEVIRQTSMSPIDLTWIVPLSELFTEGGIPLHWTAKLTNFIFREWDWSGIKDDIKVLSFKSSALDVFLPFNRPNIVFPFHFFR